VAREVRPDVVVCLGDEIDAHSFSRFPRDPELASGSAEVAAAREALGPWFGRFKRVAVCRSNHAERPYKRAAEAGIPRGFLRAIGEVLDAPRGWQWAESWDFDGVRFFHGDGFSGRDAAIKAAAAIRQSVVIGHVHTAAGVLYSASNGGQLFGLSAGCLVDAEAAAFSYAKHNAARPILGLGLVLDGVPSFVPMPCPSAAVAGRVVPGRRPARRPRIAAA
jgi:hypothetical protein